MTKITFVGCGNMAQAMISGLRASKQKFHVCVIEKNKELKNKIQKQQQKQQKPRAEADQK